jgi:hypothetical protein
MEYLWFVLIIIVLLLALVGLNKIDKREKNKYRKAAYTLLETVNPDLKEIKNTIKGLRLYGGRWRKDQEFVQLVKRLQDKINGITG